jgi:hypothetical protein
MEVVVPQAVPLCQVCNHNHLPAEKCPICGHVGGKKVYRGPTCNTLHFNILSYPGKKTGKRGRRYTKNYIIVKMLRYKIKQNIDFSNITNKKQRHGESDNNRITYNVSEEEQQKDQQGIHMIGLIGDAPVSVLTMFRSSEGYVVLENIGVLPSYQGKGYCRKMVIEASNIVKKKDPAIVGFILDCPAKRNIFEIFKKLNFHPLAEGAQRFNKNGEQVCRMVCNF